MATEAQLRSQRLTSLESQRRTATIQQKQEINLQRKKQEQEARTVQDKVNKTIEEINSGKITEYEQIPSDVRQLVNIDKSYFQQKKAIAQAQQQQTRDAQFNLAVRVYLGQSSGGTVDFKSIPQDIKDKAREYAKSRESSQFISAQASVVSSVEQVRQQTLTPEEREAIKKSVKIEGNKITYQPIQGGMSYAKQEDLKQMSFVPMSYATPSPGPYKAPDSLKEKVSSIPGKVTAIALKGVQKVGQGVGFIGETVRDIPIKTSFLPLEVPRQIIGGPESLGELASKSKERTKQLGEKAGKGYENIFISLGVPLDVTTPEKTTKVFKVGEGSLFKDITIPQRTSKTSAGYFVSLAKESPSLIEYTYGFPLAIGRDVIDVGEKSKYMELEAEKKFRSSYEAQEKKAKAEGVELIGFEESRKELFPEFSKEYKTQKELEAGVIGLFALGGVGLKGGKYLFESQVTREGAVTGAKTPQLLFEDSSLKGIRTLKDTPQGPQWFQSYKADIMVEPYIEKSTSNFRKLAGLNEKVRVISPAKYYRVETPFGQLGEKAFVLKQSKLGKGGFGEPKYTFVLPQGSKGGFTAEEITKEGKFPEWLLSKLAQKKTGVPSSSNIVPKLFGETDSFGTGTKSIIDLGKQEGRRTSTYLDLTRENLIKELPSGAKTYSVDVVSKDITKPFARRSGKTPIISGKILELPYTPQETSTGITVITSSSSRKTPLSTTFAELAKPKIVIPKFSKPRVITKVVPKEPVISIVGPTKTEVSLYTGTGLYERTEEVSAISMPGRISTNLIDSPKPSISTIQSSVSTTLETQSTSGRTKSGFSNIPKIGLVPALSPKERSEVSLGQPLKEIQMEKLIVSQKSRLKELLKSIPTTKTPQFPREPLKPKAPTIPKPFAVPKPSSSKKPVREFGGEFTALGKRFGKDIQLGKGSKKEAELLLGKFLKTTLGASGKIKKGETLLKAEDISLLSTEGFVKSKRSPYTIVEVRERRLKRGSGEIPEIQTFKRRKQSKSILGF